MNSEKLMWPKSATRFQKVLTDLAKIHQKVLPDWCKKCQNRTGGKIKKCYCKDLSQIVQGSKWAKKMAKKCQKMPKRAKKRSTL